MFDGSLPEIADLAGLDAAGLVEAARGWARAENAACARKQAVMAEIFTRRTGPPAGEHEPWWVDPEAAVPPSWPPPPTSAGRWRCIKPTAGRVAGSAARGGRTV